MLTAEEVGRRLRAQGVARVKGFVDPDDPDELEMVRFLGPEGKALRLYDPEVEDALLEATARWADGPGAFVLDLKENPPRVEVEILEKWDHGYELLRRERLSLEEFLE